MRTQLSIVQKSRVDMLHAWATKVGEFGDSNKMFRCLSCLSAACRIEDGMRFLQPPFFMRASLRRCWRASLPDSRRGRSLPLLIDSCVGGRGAAKLDTCPRAIQRSRLWARCYGHLGFVLGR
jgi:hypothetical protein